MKITYNFVSLVAIGNFNPAIITPDFLNRVCELNLGGAELVSPLEMPVIRQLKFHNLELIIELGRLSIKESGIQDISESQVIRIFRAYYDKLRYTPLTAVGVNINCQLIPGTDPKMVALAKNLQDHNTLLSFLGANEIVITDRAVYKKEHEKKWLGSDFKIAEVGGLTRQISVAEAENKSFNFNYNYEAGNLSRDLSKLDLLLDGYSEFCDEFLKVIKYLET